MLTARGEETDRVIGLELGADDYLTKPFSSRELVARVRALIRRSELVQQTLASDRTHASTILTRGPLRLDPVAHRVVLMEQRVELTPIEFALLELLMRHPGRAFSRAYLIDTIWGQSYVGGDRSVDNAMLRLRKKLGSIGDAIETVWGVGYRLTAED
jgi:DNA-binding response OmpR family regulator